jgi:nucleoside phosphorylase
MAHGRGTPLVLCAILAGLAGCAPIAPSPGGLLVVTAVGYEYDAVAGVLAHRHERVAWGRQVSTGMVGNDPVYVVRSGWNKAQAAAATALAIEAFHPRLVVVAGIGGGLSSRYVTSGDVVVSDETFQHDLGRMTDGSVEVWPPETPSEAPYPTPTFTAPPASVRAAVAASRQVGFEPWVLPADCRCRQDGTPTACEGAAVTIGRRHPRICAGTIATGDTFIVDARYAHDLVARHGAVAVDMETAAVAQEAANRGIPFLGVRVLSDVVDRPGGEDLYYCLKPFSGRRLARVMRATLSALGDEATASATSPPPVERCLEPPAIPAD